MNINREERVAQPVKSCYSIIHSMPGKHGWTLVNENPGTNTIIWRRGNLLKRNANCLTINLFSAGNYETLVRFNLKDLNSILNRSQIDQDELEEIIHYFWESVRVAALIEQPQ